MLDALLQEIEDILTEGKVVIKYDSYWFYLYFDYDIKLSTNWSYDEKKLITKRFDFSKK